MFTVQAGQPLHSHLFPIADDRLIVVSKANAKPWKVLATGSFNAADWAWPSVSYALIERDGGVRLVPYAMTNGGVKAVSPDDQPALDKHKEAITKAAPKAGATPPATEKK